MDSHGYLIIDGGSFDIHFSTCIRVCVDERDWEIRRKLKDHSSNMVNNEWICGDTLELLFEFVNLERPAGFSSGVLALVDMHGVFAKLLFRAIVGHL